MSDVLSQSEIDALLAALAAGEIIEEGSEGGSDRESETPNIVLSDSLKFAEKDIEILEYIHREYTNVISSRMFKNLNIRVSLESIQEIRYEEFMRSIPYSTVLTVFRLNPLDGYLLFETSPNLIVQVSDVFFGTYGNKKLSLTEFSEEDKKIYIKVTRDFIRYLEKAWCKVLKVKSEVKDLEVDPVNIKLFDSSDHVALVSFSITIGEVNTFFNICIPYSSIEKYSGKLEMTQAIPKAELYNNLNSTSLNIKVVLGNLQLSLEEILNLQKGTILDTNKKYENKANILVEGKHCFNGEIGLINNHKAVKIVNCIDKDV